MCLNKDHVRIIEIESLFESPKRHDSRPSIQNGSNSTERNKGKKSSVTLANGHSCDLRCCTIC